MEESIVISKWPTYRDDRHFEKEEKDIETIKEAVRGIRNVRSEMNVAPGKKTAVAVASDREDILATFTEGKLFFASLAGASEVTMLHRTGDGSGEGNASEAGENVRGGNQPQEPLSGREADIAKDSVSVVIPGATLYIPLADLVDIAQEIGRLEKEHKRLEGEVARAGGMLSNERFLSKAPEEKVAQEREKLAKYTQMLEQVDRRLKQLQEGRLGSE